MGGDSESAGARHTYRRLAERGSQSPGSMPEADRCWGRELEREGLRLEEAAYLRLLILVAPGAAGTGAVGQLVAPEPKLLSWMRYSRNGLPSGEAASLEKNAVD